MVAHALRRRKLTSGKFLCGFHERHLAKKRGAAALEGPPALSLMAPLSAPPAKKLLEEMRAAVQLETKSQLLSKLHAAPKSCKLQFVYDGGLEILEKWIRQDPPLQKASLSVLKDLPVTAADLKKARLREALETLGREGDDEEPDELLAQWQAQGLFSVPARSVAPPNPAGPVPDEIGSIDPELRQLHPRIAEFLASRPVLLKFLKAQPGAFLKNLSSRSVALLVRLQKARLGLGAAPAAASSEAAKANRANRTVQVTGLGEDAEDDVEWLLQKLREVGLQECKQTGVELPRESHYSQPCWAPKRKRSLPPAASTTGAGLQKAKGRSLPSDSKLRWWAPCCDGGLRG
ncbi:pks3 [Symbiodinium sp. CCMP2592]|nr:pks3 [Symbiodinium sp. CCMP2592]